MRSELRKRYLMVAMALILVAVIPLVQLQLIRCAKDVDLFGVAIITDREDTVIYDGAACTHREFRNLVGGTTNRVHLIGNSLACKYQDDLAPAPLNVVTGYRGVEGLESKIMTTTLLPGDCLAVLTEVFGEYDGAVFAYNYKTGEVLCCLSLPSGLSESDGESAMYNKVINGIFTPGSTMKVVALICALSQNPELISFTHSCGGSFKLPDGSEVTCGYNHGSNLTMKQALGRSCNCYMAALITQFNVKEACQTLEKLGFAVNENAAKDQLDKLSRSTSSTVFESTATFSNVWSLIGQGDTQASLVDMARIAGAVANSGEAAVPYMVESIYDPNEEEYTYTAEAANMETLLSAEVADVLDGLWGEAVDAYFRSGKSEMDPIITYAKTGTAQIEDGNGGKYTNRLLVGTMQEYDVAFAVVVEELPSSSALVVEVANTLAHLIPSAGEA